MNILKALWILPILTILNIPAYAGNSDHSHRFENKQEKQYSKIKNGLRNGSLTRKEAKQLRREQQYISKLRQYFLRDGKLKYYERRTLKNELKWAKKNIRTLSNNDSVRGRYKNKGYRYDDYNRHASRNRNSIKYYFTL